ncbi:MAG: hypothetical protein IPI35_24880 [Deltaproteobacteria bacterium]|nr:hypothetical protein [Deltaproteobacteria bacterium]
MRPAPLVLSVSDLLPAERGPRLDEALARFTITPILAPGPEFEEVYAFLDAEFGPKNELEAKATLAGWLGRHGVVDGLFVAYHLLSCRDADGALAGARDCFVIRRGDGPWVVLLSHVLIGPAWRRSGLGALLRAAPVALLRAAGARDDEERVLAAEQELIDPADEASIVRQLAYGRAGFSALNPQVFPYAQPDFRPHDVAAADPKPVPMMLTLRRLGLESATEAPAALAWAVLDAFDVIHGEHCLPGDLAARRALAEVWCRDPVPMMRFDPRQPEAAAPLLRAATLPLLPRRLGGTEGAPVGTIDDACAALRARWSA